MGVALGGGRTPNYKKLMVFVDGTNFLLALKGELSLGPEFRADKPPAETLNIALHLLKRFEDEYGMVKIRKYWFSSYQGSEKAGERIAKELRECGFEPVLFKKKKGRKEKRVDIALAKEMLVNAFHQNFDVGYLVAGDEDYVDLVNEVKRYGQIIRGAFFGMSMSDKLEIALDDFVDIIDSNQGIVEGDIYKGLVEKLKEEYGELPNTDTGKTTKDKNQ